MEAKPFAWIARHRLAVILTVTAVAVGAIGIRIYLPIAARDRMLQHGDALLQAMPTPAGGHVQNRSSTRRSGWFDQAMADSPVTQDSWDATFDLDTVDSPSQVTTTYATQLSQAGWNRDAACVAKGAPDGVSTDVIGVVHAYSGCWTKDGFSLDATVDTELQASGYQVFVTMTDPPYGGSSAT